ncbi:MAG: periplasmic heavy metal sensor [candidate division KSB1 bacterium]|nr:periplasmic heavy metal sensor [candidate division KSB1 bacterium]
MTNKLFRIAFVLALFLLVQNAMAQGEPLRPFRGGQTKKVIEIQKEVIDRDLNLTDEQEKAFKKIDLSFRKETVALRNDLQIKQLELQAELSEDKPDAKKIESLIDDIAKLRAAIQKKRISAHLQKRNLLNADQRKILDRQCPWWGKPFERMHMGPARGRGPLFLNWLEKYDYDDEEEEEK